MSRDEQTPHGEAPPDREEQDFMPNDEEHPGEEVRGLSHWEWDHIVLIDEIIARCEPGMPFFLKVEDELHKSAIISAPINTDFSEILRDTHYKTISLVITRMGAFLLAYSRRAYGDGLRENPRTLIINLHRSITEERVGTYSSLFNRRRSVYILDLADHSNAFAIPLDLAYASDRIAVREAVRGADISFARSSGKAYPHHMIPEIAEEILS